MISIDKSNAQPFYEQIVLSVKQNILLGIFEPDEKLPSVRELANRLMMNPNTIAKAYKLLESEGVIMTKKGLGTFISSEQPQDVSQGKMTEWKERLKPIITETKFAHVSADEVVSWVKELYEEGEA